MIRWHPATPAEGRVNTAGDGVDGQGVGEGLEPGVELSALQPGWLHHHRTSSGFRSWERDPPMTIVLSANKTEKQLRKDPWV